MVRGRDSNGKRISNDPWSCGDGLCSTYNQSRFEVFDATGTRKGDYAINSLIKPDLLDNANIANFIDVPGKGVYALVGYNTSKKKARAELIRLDGVY
ncbi:Hypothetical protein A7982_04339 [Minicystis rosea]|nr:Hypothetical protein A7982_04339 [Minicystis rosea]